MIHLLYGGDDLSLHEELSRMKEDMGPAELRDVNITVLEGRQGSFDQLAATCDTVPFLADKRMVIVEGLLSTLEPRSPSRPRGRGGAPQQPKLGQWEALPEYLSRVPDTTELVFVEGLLSESNPLLARLRSLAQTRTFPVPTGSRLRQWIGQRAAKWEADIEPRAVDTLAESIGGNLRGIDLELQKLSLYRWGQKIRQQDVQELVAYAKEANIFAAVDAVIEGRPGHAIPLVHQILDSGRAPSYFITMMARQVRFLLLAKELKAQGVPSAQIGRQLSLSGYPLRKILEQEGRLTGPRLAQIHRKLLEADLSIKTGEADEHLVLDMLIAELAAAAAPGRG